ncbi:PEGA domain-containing protein [Candidatus Woesearchaeota archaeon]|nr:PEGA domain-containing protein [Candidatus Woesearchaeota archaeon]
MKRRLVLTSVFLLGAIFLLGASSCYPSITFKSEPSEATVIVDGQQLDTPTPAYYPSLPNTDYDVVYKKEGYIDEGFTVEVASSSIEVNKVLTPASQCGDGTCNQEVAALSQGQGYNYQGKVVSIGGFGQIPAVICVGAAVCNCQIGATTTCDQEFRLLGVQDADIINGVSVRVKAMNPIYPPYQTATLELGENVLSCGCDCSGTCCGNGICEIPFEDSSNCPADCQ